MKNMAEKFTLDITINKEKLSDGEIYFI